MTTRIELINIAKSYGAVPIIDGLDLTIEPGEFTVFVGPSGCGKSTLLRMIAGLETITSGDLVIDGERVNDVAASKRGIAMVFQSYALYPHMSVYKNLAFGLETAGLPKAEIETRVREAAGILKIDSYLHRRPKDLSGGQRQRVAIGRAIVRQPRIFLFDEPLSNLDAELRVKMRVEISRLHQDIGNTMIYVTHDQVEAMTMADKIVVLRGGKIMQVGAPLDLYNHPANEFVAGFIGSPRMNFLRIGPDDGSGRLSVLSHDFSPDTLGYASPKARPVNFGLRPEQIQLGTQGPQSLGEVTVQLVEHLGGGTVVHSTGDTGETLTIMVPGQVHLQPGARVPLSFDPSHAHLFDDAGAKLARRVGG